MSALVIYAVIAIGLALISLYLASKTPKPKPAEDVIDEFRISGVQVGTPVPIVLGIGRIGGEYIELGEFIPVEHRDTENMGKYAGNLVNTYYTYQMKAGVGICLGPVDYLFWISMGQWCEDFSLARSEDWISLTGYGVILSGKFYWGTNTQEPDSILETVHEDQPAYRNLAYFAGLLDLGRGTAPPQCSWIVGCYPQPLESKPASMGVGYARHMNVPQGLYWVLTNYAFLLGISASDIDTASFEAASDVLIEEGLGGSVVINEGESDLSSPINELLDWIGGVLVEKKGMLYLYLTRNEGYSAIITDTDIERGSFELCRPSWNSLKSGVIVQFKDSQRRLDNNSVYLSNEALVSITGHRRIAKYNFNVAGTQAMAIIVATRLLYNLSYPYSRLDFITTRSDLSKEQVIRVLYSVLSFQGDYRIINYDDLGKGRYKVEAVENITDIDFPFETQVGTATGWETVLFTGPLVYSIWETHKLGMCILLKRPFNDVQGSYCERAYGVQIAATWAGGTIAGSPWLTPISQIGVLRSVLPASKYYVDRENVIEVTAIETISIDSAENDIQWFAGLISLRVGNEIIFAKTVTVETWGWTFSNLIRARDLSLNVEHLEDEAVQLIDSACELLISPASQESWANYILDLSLTGKYLNAGGFYTDVENAVNTTQLYVGRKVIPCPVSNIQIGSLGNASKWHAGETIVFNWRDRTRIGGAGDTPAGTTTPAENEPEYEYFRIEVYQSAELKKTYNLSTVQSDLLTWSYTSVMRSADGVSDADFELIIYPVRGYLTGDGTTFTATYES